MLFPTHIFILYLIIVVTGFYTLIRFNFLRSSIAWLVVASIFFYGWWNPAYVWILIASILFNYFMGIAITKAKNGRILLFFGVSANLLILIYYKYAIFIYENVFADTTSANASWELGNILLPLAISFFTFQQISYLVDAHRKIAHEYDFLNYSLFVSFFPQLIAGPIVHYKEMMPQFARSVNFAFDPMRIAVGASLFIIGIIKKVGFADQIGLYTNTLFLATEAGDSISFIEAWLGMTAFTFEIYFDFSGYMDMAMGAAYMLGIRLPLNFYSPYKSTSIIEFWKSWHMTLSRFLRDYVYIPLGGNRRGYVRRYINILFVMLIGGLWHGASWTFAAWGMLHGFFIVINHLWRDLLRKFDFSISLPSKFSKFLGWSLTMFVVIVAWVFFRAPTFEQAILVLKGMFGQSGYALPVTYKAYFPDALSALLETAGWHFETMKLFLGLQQVVDTLGLFLIAVIMPNSLQFMSMYRPSINIQRAFRTYRPSLSVIWQPNLLWTIVFAIMGIYALTRAQVFQEFIYFNF